MLSKNISTDEDSEQVWDMRVDKFNAAVKADKIGFVEEVVNSLDQRGILKGEDILDIGGGIGRYTIPFAQKANSVTMTDISGKMLDLAKQNALEEDVTNIQYEKLTWEKEDLKFLGLERKFDLAFASMCPAVKSLSGLNNMIASSRKYCLINQFIVATDSLSEFLVNRSGLVRDYDPHNDREVVSAIFNLLWINGYCPEIQYLTSEDTNIFSVEDILRSYAFVFENIEQHIGMKAQDLIEEYRSSHCGGKIF